MLIIFLFKSFRQIDIPTYFNTLLKHPAKVKTILVKKTSAIFFIFTIIPHKFFLNFEYFTIKRQIKKSVPKRNAFNGKHCHTFNVLDEKVSIFATMLLQLLNQIAGRLRYHLMKSSQQFDCFQ